MKSGKFPPIVLPLPRLLSVMTDVMIEPISGTTHPTMDSMSVWLPITDAVEEGDWRDANTGDRPNNTAWLPGYPNGPQLHNRKV